jgi:hypothetical protein
MSFIDNYSTIGPGIGSGAGPLNILSNPANTSSGIAGLFANNPNLLTTLGLGGAAVGLGLFEQNQPLPYQSNQAGIATELNQTAGTASGEASTLYDAGVPLVNALASGQLPPGAQAEVQQYLDNVNAATKSRYASLGQTGSTMETDALNTNKTNAQALTSQTLQQMTQQGDQLIQQSLQGLSISGGLENDAANIYGNLMKAQMQQNTNVLTTIGNFASALGNALGLGKSGSSGGAASLLSFL